MARKFIFLLFIALLPVFAAAAQSSSGTVTCPVISVRGTAKYFPVKSRKFICYRSERLAKKAGLSRSSNQTVLSIDGPANTPTPKPTSTPSDVPTRNLDFSGTASGATDIFYIRLLPAVAYYDFQCSSTDTFYLLLRDASTGYLKTQLAFGRGTVSNANVISVTGSYYLEIKTGPTCRWKVRVQVKS